MKKFKRLTAFFVCLSLSLVSFATYPVFASQAPIKANACGLSVDAQGNLYYADKAENKIVKILKTTGESQDLITAQGAKSDGSHNFEPLEAKLNKPQGLAITKDASVMYISDTESNALHRAVFKENERSLSRLTISFKELEKNPSGLLQDQAKSLSKPKALSLLGGFLFLADSGNKRILSINTKTLEVADILQGDFETILAVGSIKQSQLFAANKESEKVGVYELDYKTGQISKEPVKLLSAQESGKDKFTPSGLAVKSPTVAVSEANPLYIISYESGKIYCADLTNEQLTTFAPTTPTPSLDFKSEHGEAIAIYSPTNERAAGNELDLYVARKGEITVLDNTKPYLLKDSLEGNVDKISLSFSEPIKNKGDAISLLLTRLDAQSKEADKDLSPYPTSLGKYTIDKNQLIFNTEDLSLPEGFLKGSEDNKSYSIIFGNITDKFDNKIIEGPYELSLSNSAILRPTLKEAALITFNGKAAIELSFETQSGKMSTNAGSLTISEYYNDSLRKTFSPLGEGTSIGNNKLVIECEDIPFDLSGGNKSYKLTVGEFSDINGLKMSESKDFLLSTATLQEAFQNPINSAPVIVGVTPAGIFGEKEDNEIYINTSGFMLTFSTLMSKVSERGKIELIDLDNPAQQPIDLLKTLREDSVKWGHSKQGGASTLSVEFPPGVIKRGTSYSLEIGGFKSIFNKEMQSKSLSFVVSKESDKTQPKLARFDFKNKEVVPVSSFLPVTLTDQFTIVFDKPMTAEGQVTLFCEGVKQKPLKILSWEDDYSMGGGKNSKLNVSLEGNILEKDKTYTLKFTDFSSNANPPISLYQGSGSLIITLDDTDNDPPKLKTVFKDSISSPFVLEFDEPINVSAGKPDIKISPSNNGDPILPAHFWDIENKRLTLTFDSVLSEGVSYTLSAEGFSDLEGNAAQPIVHTFKPVASVLPEIIIEKKEIINLQASSQPTVISVKPDLSEKISTDTKELTIEFDREMQKLEDYPALPVVLLQENKALGQIIELTPEGFINGKEYVIPIAAAGIKENTEYKLIVEGFKSAIGDEMQDTYVGAVKTDLPDLSSDKDIKEYSLANEEEYDDDTSQSVEVTAINEEPSASIGEDMETIDLENEVRSGVAAIERISSEDDISEDIRDASAEPSIYELKETSSEIDDDEVIGVFQNNSAPIGSTTIASHWASPYMKAAVDKNIISPSKRMELNLDKPISKTEYMELLKKSVKGYQDITTDSFEGDNVLTREEMADMTANALVVRANLLKLPEKKGEEMYGDFSQIDEKYAGSVMLMYENNIMRGTEEHTFAPKERATIGQALLVLCALSEL